MKRTTIIATALLSMMIVSCNKFNPTPTCEKENTEERSSNDMEKSIGMPMQIPFQLVGNGPLYGGGAEGITQSRYVIRNAGTWNWLKNKMNSVNEVTPGFVEENIDFSQWTVLAVFDKVRPNPGYGIGILEVVQKKKKVYVTVGKSSPSPDQIVPMVIVQPFHIVKIPKTNAPIIFN